MAPTRAPAGLIRDANGVSHGVQQTLHIFTGGTDSEYPASVLVLQSDGTLWGTASGASPNRLGATFRLTPPASGGKAWTETIVHTFEGGATDGATPNAGLTQGAGGVLYGVTMNGGNGSRGVCGPGCRTMFHITPLGRRPGGGTVAGSRGAAKAGCIGWSCACSR